MCLETEIRILRAEKAALRKDAIRYRWLRQQPEAQELMDNGGQWFTSQNHDTLTPDGPLLDAAVDAAIAKERADG